MRVITFQFYYYIRAIGCGLLLLVPVTTQAKDNSITVGVSILPEKYFVQRIAGDSARVIVMVGQGYNPATYEPKPKQLLELSKAAVYFLIGVPFEQKWTRMFSQNNPAMKIVSLVEGMNFRRMDAIDRPQEQLHEEGHRHGVWDPHVWLNPMLVKRMANTIKDVLAGIDPANRLLYESNYQSFIADLDKLDSSIRRQLSSVKNNYIVVFHPSWGYYADAYGLVQLPIEHEGKQPGAKTLAGLLNRVKDKNIKAIFVQPQFSDRDAITVAEQIGAKLVPVDPLAEDYLVNMERVTRSFAEALQ